MFGKNTIDNVTKEIQKLYLKDEKPWIIGYSGGKDSTATTQLVYSAILGLTPEQRHKDIWVISSDTLVEIPTVMDRVDTTIEKLNDHAQKNKIPITAHKVSPPVNESFFVNLIGRGYPAPTRTFRWCTDRMKIQPSSDFIVTRIAKYGEVIIVLGSRKKESMSRAQTMANYEIKGSMLRRHATLQGAFVYSPVEDWETDDVWEYLATTESPWGDDNIELVLLYRKAGGDECPVIVDTTTPSCGNSRFGCWVCTVVEQDKSIKGFIESGESWLQPMADFRDLIKDMRERREEFRIPDSSRIGGYGAFILDARKIILKELLKTDKSVYETYKQHLIKSEELWAIQKLWKFDSDKENSVSKIYREVYKRTKSVFKRPAEAIQKRKEEELYLLDLCEEYKVSYDLINRMIFIEKDLTKMRRRAGLFMRLDRELSRVLEDQR